MQDWCISWLARNAFFLKVIIVATASDHHNDDFSDGELLVRQLAILA
jgi:hypothetical protein